MAQNASSEAQVYSGEEASGAGGVVERQADVSEQEWNLLVTAYQCVWIITGCIAAFSSGFFAEKFGRYSLTLTTLCT